jgi:hypothetical protein
VAATWDQGLTEALVRAGRSVPEELLVGALLEDLDRAG